MNRTDVPVPDDELEGRLRSAFAQSTEALASTPDPWQRTARAITRDRARRRSRAVGLAAAVLALLAVIAVLPHARPAAVRPAQHERVTGADFATWPTRGNLAGRADLLAQVRQTAPGDGGPVQSVPFLGETGGLQVGLAVAKGPEGFGPQLVLAYRDTRAGHGSPDWQSETFGVPPVGQIPMLSAVVPGNSDAVLVVLTLSEGVDLALSTNPDVGRSGDLSRRYTRLPQADGVVLAKVPGAGAGHPVVRAQRGSAVSLLPVSGVGAPISADPATAASRLPASCRGIAVSDQYASSVQNGLRDLGFPQGPVSSRVAWCRRIHGEELMLVAVRPASGPGTDVLVEGENWANDGGGMTSSSWPVPATGPDLPTLRRLQLVLDPSAGSPVSYLVYAPGARRVDLLRPSIGSLTVAALDRDGVGVAQLLRTQAADPEATLVGRDSGGREVARARQHVDDPWGQTLDGPVTSP